MEATSLNQAKPQFLTLTEAAQFLNIRVSRLRTAVFRKEIPVIRIGRLLRFDVSDLNKWIHENKQSTREVVQA